WSALNPDAVQDITLRSGASRSEDGSRLSGTVDVRTSLLGGDSVQARGAVTPGDVRQLVRGELLEGRGNFLLSGRRSVRNFFGDETALGEQNGYDDWLGELAFKVGRGRLRILLYSSANQLAFESRPDAAPAEPIASPSPNSLEWGSRTGGITWEGRVGDQALGVTAWRAAMNTSVQWFDPSRPLGVANQFVELGVRGKTTWSLGEGDLTAGFSIRQLHSGYDAHALNFSSSQPPPPELELSSDPIVIAGSLQRRWRWSDAVSLEAGLRGTWASFGWIGSEPWLALRVQPWRGLTLTAQAGRGYQFTQSWINEESFLTTVAGLELPVAAGAPGVPVARSDNLTARLELNPGSGWTLGLEGYARDLANLALASPTTPQTFTAVEPGIGRGSAAGLIARSSLARGPVELAASVGLTRASRTVGAVGYTPAFERTGFLHAAALLHLDPTTALGLAVTAGSGQSTTPLTAFDWQPYNPWNGNGELSGTPANLGSIDSYRLPGLRRLDLGVQREWRLRQWPSGHGIVTSLTVENLLNYPNAIGVLQPQPGLRTELLSAGSRIFRLELGWAF
ncbi:MAG TPA: TonB-dependent receptor, partial [Gemmatimonadales bacterium]|nr:TonB-dependent receptor [Gemmatimonadales bacterium]